MNTEQKDELTRLAQANIGDGDPSHDYLHACRVLHLAERVAAEEGGDLDIIVPAALFHDIVMYPKDDPRSSLASVESAEWAKRALAALDWYPAEKIGAVAKAIERCSFSKHLPKESLEEHIVQDADLLESLGAISVARTFSSCGQLGRLFYHTDDPCCLEREASPRSYALDLFLTRLFRVEERLHTAAARRIAEDRARFTKAFYDQFLAEIEWRPSGTSPPRGSPGSLPEAATGGGVQ